MKASLFSKKGFIGDESRILTLETLWTCENSDGRRNKLHYIMTTYIISYLMSNCDLIENFFLQMTMPLPNKH